MRPGHLDVVRQPSRSPTAAGRRHHALNIQTESERHGQALAAEAFRKLRQLHLLYKASEQLQPAQAVNSDRQEAAAERDAMLVG